MNLLFFQYCVSPHQMPYIKLLSTLPNVEELIVISPYTDLGERKDMGWHVGDYGVKTIIAPSDNEVRALLERFDNKETWCLFSGINAFKEVANWMKMSLKYDVRRGVITEPPRTYIYPLWMHWIRFALKDWRYVKYFDRFYIMGDEYVSYYQMWSKKWHVIPFMYCTDWKERTMPVPSSKKLRLLFVGELCHRKNVGLLLDAIKGNEKTETGIVGDGDEREMLMTKARENGDNVTFYGSKPMEEVANIMQQYDVLVLPSRQDGWGAVVNEALTLGLYVICSDQCGAKFLLRDESRGMIFRSESCNDLRGKIAHCVEKIEDIRGSVESRIEWSRENISMRAVAEYFLNGLK